MADLLTVRFVRLPNVTRKVGLALVLMSAVIAIASCGDDFEADPVDEGPTSQIQQAYEPAEDADILLAVKAVTKKYNLPRWFYYAVIQRESSFIRCAWNANDDGRGITQLTERPHNGFPFPGGNKATQAGLPTIDNNNSYWRGDKRLDNPLWLDWVRMKDVTELRPITDPSKHCPGIPNDDLWGGGPDNGAYDPLQNLERYSTAYAAPMYAKLLRETPDTTDVLLRKVAYHWRWGIWPGLPFTGDPAEDRYPRERCEDPYLKTSPENPAPWVCGSGQASTHYPAPDGAPPAEDCPTCWDVWRDHYKPLVENDPADGVWEGPACRPPYREWGCEAQDDRPLSVTSSGTNRLRVFYRGKADGALYRKEWDPSISQVWTGPHPMGGILTASPVAVTHNDGVVNANLVFGRGLSGTIYYWHKTNSNGWSGYVHVGSPGGFIEGAITAAFDGIDTHLFVRGPAPSYSLYTKRFYYSNGTWQHTAWQSLGFAGFKGVPSATMYSVGRLLVFVRGQGNDLRYRDYKPTQNPRWGAEASLDGSLKSSPSAVVWSNLGKVDVFARGINNGLWHRTWPVSISSAPSNWGAWAARPGVLFVGDPVAARVNADDKEVFVRNALGHTSYLRFVGATPQPWGTFASADGLTGGLPAAVAWGGPLTPDDRMDLFVRTTQGNLAHRARYGVNAWYPGPSSWEPQSTNADID